MIPKGNFHTHTTFCDGRESAESMVLAAIEKGFIALGFSGHSYTAFDERYCMSKEGTKQYCEEIARLQEVYQDQIQLYCGVEQDFYSDESTTGFQYVIGSVHYMRTDGQYVLIDESAEICKKDIREIFGGDPYAYAKLYFETVGQVLEKTGGDIIGHFDLVTKFNEGNVLFDASNKKYLRYAFEAVDQLLPYGKPFEINTGAIYRGMRTEPYPSVEILREIYQRGGSVILSSDSHDGDSLGFRFSQAYEMIKEMGFQRQAEGSFVFTK